jgi:hypothetical protein
MLIPSDTSEDLRPLVRAATIAEVCSVTTRAISLWAQNGLIPCIRIGKKTVRFIPGHVEMALGLPHGIIRPQIPKKEIQPLDRRLEKRWI